MEEHIFVTPEGFDYKPISDSPDPDLLDLHFFNFDPDATVQDTIKELMELNAHIAQQSTMQNLPFALNIEPQRRMHWPRGIRQPILAS